MATLTLEQVVNSILTPAEQNDGIIDVVPGNRVNIHEFSQLMRDVPMHTIGDVMLWIIAAQTSDTGVRGTYSYTVTGGMFYQRDLSLWDIHTVTIEGVCATVDVNFAGLNVMSVNYNETRIPCDTIEFHKGDFILSLNGKNAGIISGVW